MESLPEPSQPNTPASGVPPVDAAVELPESDFASSPDDAPTEVPSSRLATAPTVRVEGESTHSDLVAKVAIACAAQQSPITWLAEHGYQIEGSLGRGGHGEVFAAKQLNLGRDVAIKVPRADVVLTPEFQRRFLDEAQIVSQLEHPNVVVIHDMIAEPCPAIIYEHCSGGTLESLISGGKTLDETAAVKLFALLADALGFAHERAVLHRDLKPSNIMLVPSDRGTEQHAFYHRGRWYTPKLADFGLAKLDTRVLGGDDASETATGMVPGTPDYMPPEQTIGRGRDVGTFSDTFSFGVVMYRTLMGTLPFKSGSQINAILRIENSDFELPRRRRPELSTDLESVILKALKPAPADRYRDGRQLADDLQRLHQGLPVDALPYTWRNRVQHFVRRYPTATLTTILTLLCLLSVITVIWRHNVVQDEAIQQLAAVNSELKDAIERSERSELAEIRQRERAERLLQVSEMRLASNAFQAGDMTNYRQILENHAPALDKADHRSFSWNWLWEQGHPQPQEIDRYESAAHTVELSPDGKWLLTAAADGYFRIYQTSDWSLVVSHATDQGEVNCACFSPGLKYIATSGDDGTVKIWNRETLQLEQAIECFAEQAAFAVRFVNRDTQVAVCGRESEIMVWDWRSGELAARLAAHDSAVHELRVSADGKQLVSAGRNGQSYLWDTESWTPLRSLQSIREQVIADVVFFNEGEESWVIQAALPGSTNAHALLTLQSTQRKEQHILQSVATGFQSLAAVEGLGILIVGYHDGGIAVMDISDFLSRPQRANPQVNVLQRWSGHGDRVYCIDLAPDNKYFVSCSRDGKVHRWPLGGNQQVEFLDLSTVKGLGRYETLYSFAYAPQMPSVFFTTNHNAVAVWNPLQQQAAVVYRQPLEIGVNVIVANSAGTELYIGNTSGQVKRLDVSGLTATDRWSSNRAVRHHGDIPAGSDMAISPGGGILAQTISRSPDVLALLDTNTGRLIGQHTPPGWTSANTGGVSFSPQSDDAGSGRIAYAYGNQLVALQWETPAAVGEPLLLQELGVLAVDVDHISAIAFQDHNTVIATTSSHQLVRWDLNHPGQFHRFKGQCGPLLHYSPAANEIWTSFGHHAILTWCPFTSQSIINIPIPVTGANGSIDYIGEAVIGRVHGRRLFLHPLNVAKAGK